ncbi:LysE family translocator [Aquibacillus sp. 3ASR75-11]|uniref:LysE family translocator n=1 Tax=Terrihalobacillus insolitus TaxID=2950438 RepID=A0A9X3WTL2_9BACI|nr:LysE family transporter [Terrihalobacillus insolitus]MDC3413234.1 LysE family translocator [Terrihalobacillus insolitus]MDC3425712.1 LysE family translocator [Terrihalobacillus insolitus]
MTIYLSYILLGLSLAAPIGPVNAAQLDRGIKSGFFYAWLVGLGSLASDILFMLAVYFGVVHFLETPFMKTFLWSFGSFVLIYSGIEGIVGAGKVQSNYFRQGDSATKSFFTGFLMALSNPLSILFWLGIYGSVLAQTSHSYDHYHLLLYSSAILLGLIVWDVSMAAVSSGFRRLLTDRVLKGISIFSGLSLIGFGLYFGYQAAIMLL